MGRKLLVFSLIFLLGSCAKNAEQDALSQAQGCLDQVSDSDPTAATQCMSYIQDYTSQQASILKCAIMMTSGGLIESKMVQAYTQLQSGNSQSIPAAAFLTALSLNLPDSNTGYQTAKAADVYCQASGVAGLQYVSSAIVAGSFMISTLGHTIDPTSPSDVKSAIQSLVSDCTGLGSCSPTTLGTEVLSLSSAYCSSSSADTSMCSQISSAKTAAGSDPTKVGQAFLCYLDSKTYVPASGSCL